MNNRQLLQGLGIVVPLVVLLSVYVSIQTAPKPRINRETFNRIEEIKRQRGITLREIEALIGAPPGCYNYRPITYTYYSGYRYWVSDEGVIQVLIGNNEQVLGVYFTEFPTEKEETVGKKLRRQLGLP